MSASAWRHRHVCVATLAVALAAPPCAAAKGDALLHAEAAVCHAIEAGDVAAVRTALGPRFTLVGSTGAVQDRASFLDEIAHREPRYTLFRNDHPSVRRFGRTALIVGVTHVRGTAGGAPFAADLRYTDTWILAGRRWRLVASHASRLATEGR